MDAAVLPVKRLDRAKQRLSRHFSSTEVVEIAKALFDDALELCTRATFLKWWVVSDDDAVLEAASSRGVGTIRERGGGLNDALGQAVQALLADRVESVTVVPADVPLAYEGDLEDLLDTGATSDVVVVPSERDGGTNGLYLSPPDVIEPRFGPSSFQAHLAAAERLALRCSILSLPRLALDIDTIEDVDALLARPRHAPSRAVEVLERLRGDTQG